jgi:hypothetical protein
LDVWQGFQLPVLKYFFKETLTVQYDWKAYETVKNNMRTATQFDGWHVCARHFYWRTFENSWPKSVKVVIFDLMKTINLQWVNHF